MKATDVATLHAAYVEHRQELFTYALSITGQREAAEDALHRVFERLLRAPSLPAELRPYLFRAVRNAARDDRRRAQVRIDSIFELTRAAWPDRTPLPEPGQTDDVAKLLDELSAHEREAIVLRIYSGLTYQEIAEVFRLPVPTVASWYRRGLERLKTLLKQEA